jgi:sortase A
MSQGGVAIPRHPASPPGASRACPTCAPFHASRACPTCAPIFARPVPRLGSRLRTRPSPPGRVRVRFAFAAVVALARGLRRIGIVIPVAAALVLAGGALIAEAAYIHAKALLAQVLLERAFAATLASGQAVKPWSWADTWPVARVSVPRLDKSAIVLAGASGQALAFGPGHVERTPQPGEPGTAVYSAHRDTHFAFLGELGVGDEVLITRADRRELRFRVTGTAVVRFDASGIDPAANGRRLALVTCWPLNGTLSGPLRYVVHAEMID